jgi:C4-dicarboxylate-specific signal transduction histidine kinase
LATSERLAGLGRLTAGVAHEINNPISVVRHNLERIRDLGEQGRSHEQRKYVAGSLAATDRIVRIVRRLLGRTRSPSSWRRSFALPSAWSNASSPACTCRSTPMKA